MKSPEGEGAEVAASVGPFGYTFGNDDDSNGSGVSSVYMNPSSNEAAYTSKGYSIGAGLDLGLTTSKTSTFVGKSVNVKNNPHLKLIRLRMGGL